MGQWNTLHIIDTDKLYNTVIPAIKKDIKFVEKYVEKSIRRIFIQPSKESKRDLIDNVLNLSNQMSDDFKIHLGLKNIENQEKFKQKYFSVGFENLRIVFHNIVFSECALTYPYFKLGYRLTSSYLNFTKSDSVAEELINLLLNNDIKGAIFPGEFGIRNWFSAETISELNNHLDEIIPNLYPAEYKNHNKYAQIYTKEIKEFITLASENNFGLVSCLDPEFDDLSRIKSIGENIKWKEVNIKENLILK